MALPREEKEAEEGLHCTYLRHSTSLARRRLQHGPPHTATKFTYFCCVRAISLSNPRNEILFT